MGTVYIQLYASWPEAFTQLCFYTPLHLAVEARQLLHIGRVVEVYA